MTDPTPDPPAETTPPHPDIPPDWARALDELAGSACRRILLLGAVDRGKSTFARLLLRRLGEAGQSPALVDADIGQKDVGPPATITSARSLPGEPDGLYFVGAVDVRRHLLPLVVGTRRLVEQSGEGPVVINTPGMVQGVGRVLQGYQLESLRPDAVVTLERENEVGPVLAGHRIPRLHRLAPSPAARRRSPARRRAVR